MKRHDTPEASAIEVKLSEFSHYIPLPGIAFEMARKCLMMQMIDSIRRIRFIHAIRDKSSAESADPALAVFDPLKAAIWHKRQGSIDEAFWLVFLFVHFGKHSRNKWKLVQDVYGCLGAGHLWDWQTTSAHPEVFRQWLSEHQTVLKANGRFGNHRKYESLDAYSSNGTGATIQSYIDWIGSARSHRQLMEDAQNAAGNDPEEMFDYLYQSMKRVVRFGRTAKFDYLTMIGKMEMGNLIPGSTYVHEATGPKQGARLLFGGQRDKQISNKTLESNLKELNSFLGLEFGMQVLEDSLCNWQKNPSQYEHFIG